MMAEVFKVSYVVRGEDHPGAIVNVDQRPGVGDRVDLGGRGFTVLEVFELIPPRGEFHFLHVTLQAEPTG
jgi:hypothetical protein